MLRCLTCSLRACWRPPASHSPTAGGGFSAVAAPCLHVGDVCCTYWPAQAGQCRPVVALCVAATCTGSGCATSAGPTCRLQSACHCIISRCYIIKEVSSATSRGRQSCSGPAAVGLSVYGFMAAAARLQMCHNCIACASMGQFGAYSANEAPRHAAWQHRHGVFLLCAVYLCCQFDNAASPGSVELRGCLLLCR